VDAGLSLGVLFWCRGAVEARRNCHRSRNGGRTQDLRNGSSQVMQNNLPSFAEGIAKLGLTETLRPDDVFDVAVVGAGPAGLASAVYAASEGLRTIVLFGPETPKLYQPLGPSRAIYAGLACSPCVSASNHRKTACTDNVCMQAINVDQVFAAVVEELSRAEKSPTRALS